MIILQVLIFYKTYHLGLRDSALVHPEIALSVDPTVHFFKVYSFLTYFLKMPFNRTKLKYETSELMTYVKVIWMIKLGAVYLFGLD